MTPASHVRLFGSDVAVLQRPAILIVLSLEESEPRFACTAFSDEDLDRVVEWIDSQPALRKLLDRAFELTAE